MKPQKAEQLIRDLLADPEGFDAKGRGYDLLQAYFAGLPLETLRPLLRSQVPLVRRAAAFVASELGSQACSLLDDVIPLLASGNRHLQYHAMEVLAVCSEGERAEAFVQVVRELESDDDVLRALAMRLVSNADLSQLEAARRRLNPSDPRQRKHEQALVTLMAAGRVEPAVVAAMIGDVQPLVRRYGAIAAKRLFRELPHLFTMVGASDDADLQRFYQRVIEAERSATPHA